MISKGLVQSGAEIISAETSLYFSSSQAYGQSSSKLKGTSFPKRLVKGLAILSRPASQNTLERRRDMSRRRIYARKIPHVYALSLK